MWTSENRARYDRDELRYPSDVTDAEWALIEPLIPAAKRGGRRRKTDMRQTFNAVMYLLSTGCQWRYLPKDFPPQGTVRRYRARERQLSPLKRRSRPPTTGARRPSGHDPLQTFAAVQNSCRLEQEFCAENRGLLRDAPRCHVRCAEASRGARMTEYTLPIEPIPDAEISAVLGELNQCIAEI